MSEIYPWYIFISNIKSKYNKEYLGIWTTFELRNPLLKANESR